MANTRFIARFNLTSGRFLSLLASVILVVAMVPKIWPDIKKVSYAIGDCLSPMGDIGFIVLIICTSMLIQISVSLNKTSTTVGLFLLLIALLIVWTEQDSRQSIYEWSTALNRSPAML